MIKNLHQLEEAIEELNITKPCKIRVSKDGEEFFQIIGITCCDDKDNELVFDIHLEDQAQPKKLN